MTVCVTICWKWCWIQAQFCGLYILYLKFKWCWRITTELRQSPFLLPQLHPPDFTTHCLGKLVHKLNLSWNRNFNYQPYKKFCTSNLLKVQTAVAWEVYSARVLQDSSKSQWSIRQSKFICIIIIHRPRPPNILHNDKAK